MSALTPLSSAIDYSAHSAFSALIILFWVVDFSQSFVYHDTLWLKAALLKYLVIASAKPGCSDNLE